MLPFSVSLSDASSLAANPMAGLLSGGFVFAPVRQSGGTGNRLDNTQSPTATLTPTSNASPASAPSFGATAAGAPLGQSSILPAAIIAGGLLIVAVAMLTKK